MQSFKEINVDDTIYDSRTTINDSIKTVMSNNSGTAFPTTNLQVGMKCYRTDLGKTYTLTDVANKTWKEDNHATIADNANKLSGYPLHNGGDSTFGKIPVVGDDGVLKIGKYIDFHSANKQTTDFTTRITANDDDGTLSVSGSINANLNGNASSASSVPWSGVTGKPSTYPPSGHNHDSAYPATNGSRATGTWGINITGKANTAGTADNANKLSGYPLHNGGDSTFGKIPVVGDDGVLKIGKYIDFHSANKQTTDVTTRITANDNGTLSVSGSINANLNGNASSASSVPWTGVTNKPSTYPPSAHTHGLINSDFTVQMGDSWNDNWNDIGITNNGFALKSIRTNVKAPDWLLGNSSAGIVFGGGDTKGVISAAFGIPLVKFAGGNGNKPKWYYSLLGTSGKQYNLDSYAGAGIVSQQLSEDASYIKYANGLLVQFGTMLVQGYAGVKAYIKTLPISFKEVYSMQATLGYPCSREVSSVQIESNLTVVKLWIFNFVSSSDSVTTHYGHWLMIGTWK